MSAVTKAVMAVVVLVVVARVGAGQTTIQYVNQNATGGPPYDGSTWDKGFLTLDEALDPTRNPFIGLGAVELRVKEDTYIPDGTVRFPAGPNLRQSTFFLPEDVRIKGGWLGSEGPMDAPQGDPKNTVLSGDIGVVDQSSDNCFHVVVSEPSPALFSRLERVVVEDGNANGNGALVAYSDTGGGVLLIGSRLEIDDVIIRDNYADVGGGIALVPESQQSYLRMRKSTIRNNRGDASGAGMYVREAGPVQVYNCTFRDNGGSVLNGGGIAIGEGIHDTIFGNCRIFDNTARVKGGGVWVDYPDCNNCGYYFINCTLAFNEATSPIAQGGGMYVTGGSGAAGIMHAAHNSIFWKNTGASAADDNLYVGDLPGYTFDVTHCDIGPRIAMPGVLFAGGNGFLDNVDPVFVSENNRNFRLTLGSPCINAGHDGLLLADFLDLDDDGWTTQETLPREFFLGGTPPSPPWTNITTREVDEGGPAPILMGIDQGPTGICDIGAFEYRTYMIGL